jgi:hypothetical protein
MLNIYGYFHIDKVYQYDKFNKGVSTLKKKRLIILYYNITSLIPRWLPTSTLYSKVITISYPIISNSKAA